MESVYPERSAEAQSIAGSQQSPGPTERTILHHGKSAIVVAVNVETLFVEAEKAKAMIEFVPQVGDFVGSDEPLFMLHGGADAIEERKLRASVVLGSERTMDQDPLFAFRILVDIAIKALSKAINDPTTAVLAIDQLHRLLRSAGTRNLRTDQILNRAGQLRVIFRTPNWEDFVHLAFSEIRFYGAENMQIALEQHAYLAAVLLVPPEQTAGRDTRQAILPVVTPMLAGEILYREGRRDEGLAKLREAVNAEDALRYSESPDWILPARHSLGAAFSARMMTRIARVVTTRVGVIDLPSLTSFVW
jgi:uncharacterized membrane protein